MPGACKARVTVEVEMLGALGVGDGNIAVVVAVVAGEMVLAVGTGRAMVATLGTTLVVGALVKVAVPLIALGSVVGLEEASS